MDQAAESNFVTENQDTAPGSSSERVIEVMDSNEIVVNLVSDMDMQSNYMNNETVLGSSSEGVIEVMDSNEIPVNLASDIQSNYTNNETVLGSSSEGVIEVMDSNEIAVNLAPDIQSNYMNNETVLGSSSEGVIEVMGSNEIPVNLAPDIQSNYMKNKTENAKSKIKNKSKEMTVASLPERKSLKRGAAHPPTSDMVMDAIKALKKRNGASFEDMRKYMEEKYVVDMKRLKYHVDKFLQKSVGDGVLEKINRGGAEERFKIKKSEIIKTVSKKLPRKEGKVKPAKKMAATKKQVKK